MANAKKDTSKDKEKRLVCNVYNHRETGVISRVKISNDLFACLVHLREIIYAFVVN